MTQNLEWMPVEAKMPTRQVLVPSASTDGARMRVKGVRSSVLIVADAPETPDEVVVNGVRFVKE